MYYMTCSTIQFILCITGVCSPANDLWIKLLRWPLGSCHLILILEFIALTRTLTHIIDLHSMLESSLGS